MIPKKYIDNKKEKNLYGVDFLSAEHPGETLKDEIDFFGLTQAEVATRAGCTVQTINRIINGREPITPGMALKFERIFGGRPSAEFWLNMQSAYDRESALMKEKEKTEEEINFFKKYVRNTYKELYRLGYCKKIVLKRRDHFVEAMLQIKKFFEASSLESIHDKNILGVAFRKYDREGLNEYNLAAILQIGEKKARKLLKNPNIGDYSKKAFSEEVINLKSLIRKHPSFYLKKLHEKCLKLGVIVVYVPNIKNTFFGGATTWIKNHPVIILKVEKQWEDIFWFNFFHEAGHILNDGKKQPFVDLTDPNGKEKNIGGKMDIKNKNEDRADTFAQNILIPNFEEIIKNIDVNNLNSWIKKNAHESGVSEGIIAGRICKRIDNKNIWKYLNDFRPTIKEETGVMENRNN